MLEVDWKQVICSSREGRVGSGEICFPSLNVLLLLGMQVMLKNLEQVVNMILNGFQHPHPRVRWAAINAIGQLSTDLGPDLQTHYHQKVLPALANAMDDFQNPRVQASDLFFI
jgi:vesicle coat complex subunit